jgi:DNA repair protein RadC
MSKEHMVPLYHLELVREKNIPYTNVSKEHQAAEVFHEMLDSAPVEKMACIHLNSGRDMIGAEVVAIGDMEKVGTSMASLFRGAIKNNAAGIWMAHNHVDGRVKASMPDYAFTLRVLEASEILGIPLIDHLVVGPGAHYSIYKNRKELHVAMLQLEVEAARKRVLGMIPIPGRNVPAMPEWDAAWSIKDPIYLLEDK